MDKEAVAAAKARYENSKAQAEGWARVAERDRKEVERLSSQADGEVKHGA